MEFKKITIFFILGIFFMNVVIAQDNEKRKVLVIGLDGATFDILLPWIKEDKLPNLKKLCEEGVYGNLTSTLPTISPVAWGSFATGTNAGKHGLFDFLKHDEKYNFYPISGRDLKSKTFWKIASENGKRVVVINVPVAYPEEVNGTIISGFLISENEIFTYPENLSQELRDVGYKIEAMDEKFKPGYEDKFIKEIYDSTEKRREVTMKLMKSDWDLFIIVFTETDRMQHYLWRYMENKDKKYGDEILKYYQKIDSIIGEILNQTDNETSIIVVSDHGFGPLRGEVYLNYYLMEMGLLKLKSPLKYLLLKIGLTQQNLASFFERFPFFNLIRRGILEKIGISKITSNIPYFSYDDIDFSKTKAYATQFGGGIYLKVEKEEYEKLVENLIRELEELKDSSGNKIIKKVYRKNELWNGSYLYNAPDLVIEADEYDLTGWLGYNKLINTKVVKSGSHRKNGIIILWGVKNTNISDAKIIDVAPTILKLLDLNVPNEMDGKSLIG